MFFCFVPREFFSANAICFALTYNDAVSDLRCSTGCSCVSFGQQQATNIQRSALYIVYRCLSIIFQVIIITNSDEGWVHYSCERIVPALLPVIEKYRIVSARTSYEKFYPGQPLCWKAAAFAHEVNELFQDACPNLEISDVSSEESFDMGGGEGSSGSVSTPATTRLSSGEREIISFGDSMEERTAVRIVAEQLSSTPKSVMFVPSPTPTQIIGQLQMLTNQMKFVCEHSSSLDLEISPEQAERSAECYMKRHYKIEDRALCQDLKELVSETATPDDRSSRPLRL